MLLPKGKFLGLNNRVSPESLGELVDTGYVKVSWRSNGELWLGEVVFLNGSPVLAEIENVKSKKKIKGKAALDQILGLKEVNLEIYKLTEDNLNLAISMNKSCTVNETEPVKIGKVTGEITTTREDILKKYKIREPNNKEIEGILNDKYLDRYAKSVKSIIRKKRKP